jgi:hypothetical protein
MLLYFAPVLLVFALGVGATDMVLRAHGGHAVIAWVLVLVGSFLAAIAVSSQVLISYRHLPYLVEISAVLIGFGAWHLRRLTLPKGVKVSRAYGGACALLVVALVATAFPPKDIMGGFQEGTTEQELGASLWLQGGLPSPGADPGDDDAGTVVSDHRLSSMAYGMGGQMATWDTAGDTLHRPMDASVLAGLEGAETPQGRRPVSAVLLSEDLRSGAALLQWETAEPIEGAAWDKFFEEPFVRLYDGGEVWVLGVARPL